MDAVMTASMQARTAAPSDGSTPLIRTLTFTIFLQWLGATAIIPMLPVYIRHLGGTDTLAGVVMAAFFAAGVLFQYPLGRLADRVGRRPVLVGGLVTYSVASLSFIAPISPTFAILLRALQGAGAGAAAVAALAMISSSVAVERRGRAFASIYGGELAGMAVGPLIGSIVGIRYMWLMFIASGLMSFAACVPALRISEPHDAANERARDARAEGTSVPLSHIRLNRSMIGAFVSGSALGLTSGVYDICWTLLLLARGASGWEIGISWTLFAVPFVLAAKPSGWLADHMDRRLLVLVGIGTSALFCATYPFIHSVPALIVLGALEALGFAAALPAVQSLLTQGSGSSEVGRVQGVFATCQTACTAIAAAGAGAAFALATWIPFVTVASVVIISLGVAAFIWRSVPGRVQPAAVGVIRGSAGQRGEQAGPEPVHGVEPVGVSGDVQ
jgi:DHA1 family multidrug resistance protein-like MFS transporter